MANVTAAAKTTAAAAHSDSAAAAGTADTGDSYHGHAAAAAITAAAITTTTTAVSGPCCRNFSKAEVLTDTRVDGEIARSLSIISRNYRIRIFSADVTERILQVKGCASSL